MPLTTLDANAALIIVDLQEGLRARVGDALAPLLDANARLARAFRASGRPVVLVNVDAAAPGRTDAGTRTVSFPPEALEIMPELEPADGDIRVTKRTWGAFTGTELHAALSERGVDQVVVTGVATSAGVESTARAAHEHGYHVVLVPDAMTDLGPGMHDHAVNHVFPRLAEVADSTAILAAIDPA